MSHCRTRIPTASSTHDRRLTDSRADTSLSFAWMTLLPNSSRAHTVSDRGRVACRGCKSASAAAKVSVIATLKANKWKQVSFQRRWRGDLALLMIMLLWNMVRWEMEITLAHLYRMRKLLSHECSTKKSNRIWGTGNEWNEVSIENFDLLLAYCPSSARSITPSLSSELCKKNNFHVTKCRLKRMKATKQRKSINFENSLFGWVDGSSFEYLRVSLPQWLLRIISAI